MLISVSLSPGSLIMWHYYDNEGLIKRGSQAKFKVTVPHKDRHQWVRRHGLRMRTASVSEVLRLQQAPTCQALTLP